MTTGVRRCFRCQAELPKDSTYCISCGCQNEDLVGKQASAEFARSEQLESLRDRIARQKTFGWIFRFFGR